VVSDGETPRGEDVLKIAAAMAALREESCPTVAVQVMSPARLFVDRD